MARYKKTFYHILIAVGGGLIILGAAVQPIAAQCGDPCFNTPTPSPTLTPQPTTTGTPASTTPVPMPSSMPFPDTSFPVPTSIPLPNLPDVSGPGGLGLSTPSPLAAPAPLSVTFSLAPSMPISGMVGGAMPNVGDLISGTNASIGISGVGSAASDTVGQAAGLTGSILSYTTWLSGEIAALDHTDTFTLMVAPAWYAPYLPREMANVGWTFENLNATGGARYSVETWAGIFGSIISMPIKLSLNIWELFRFLGPFGLFVTWLLIMTPVVLGFDMLGLIKGSITWIFRFFKQVIDLIDWLIHWFWKIIVFVAEWVWRFVNWVLDWIWKILELIGNYLPGT